MRITHPQGTYQGIPPEDMFFVLNDRQVQMGTGYIIASFQQELYPARPLNLFVQIEAQSSARSLLYGALLARAEVIRAKTPTTPARMYTQLAPEDVEMAAFFEHSGFKLDDAEDLFMFPLGEQLTPRTPMGVQYASVPLETDAQQDAFLQRLNAMRISPISRDQLTIWREQPGFLALGFYRGGRPVCEMLTAGTDDSAMLVGLYTLAEYRRQGFAKALMSLAQKVLLERDITKVYAHIFRRNEPQVALMRALGGEFVGVVAQLPGIDL